MVDESMSASITSKLSSTKPQSEHKSAGTAESERCKSISHHERGHYEIASIPRKNPRQTRSPAFQSPSFRGRRKEENRIQSRHHQHQQNYHYSLRCGSPFISPNMIQRQPYGTETLAQEQIQNHEDGRRCDDLNFISSLTPSSGFCSKSKSKMGKLESISLSPEPLVLDPSAKNQPGKLGACNSEHRRITLTQSSAQLLESRSGKSTVQKLFQVATKGIREHHATAAQYSTNNGSFTSPVNAKNYLHVTPVAIDAACGSTASSAGVFARSNGVVHAGFLRKLGKNIPEFKRRFFVLKPETKLYYYLSPHDTEPRGKIDLEGTTIKEAEKTTDGRLRFLISFKNGGLDIHEKKPRDEGVCDTRSDENIEIIKNSYQQRQENIVLEARSTEVGEEWIRLMKEERVQFLKEKNEALNFKITEQANQIIELEKQIEHFRMIEADRDGALEDAQNWKSKFNRLDEALRLLTQRIRKSFTNTLAQDRNSKLKDDDSGDEVSENQIFHASNTLSNFTDNGNENLGVVQDCSSLDGDNQVSYSNVSQLIIKNNSPSSLLDGLLHENMDVEEIMDVPGTYFSGLSNACKQQNESSRLASLEASAAVEDVLKANEQVDIVQKRMHKAEKQILKLWEENCVIRKTLKQKRREKRVLVKEVKQLQKTVQDLTQNINQSSNVMFGSNEGANEDGIMADTMIGSDEERLIIELEEHVASSIRLHEQLLVGTEFDCDMEQSISTEPASIHIDTLDSSVNIGCPTFEHPLTNKTKLLSLFDDKSDSDESGALHHGLKDHNSCVDVQSMIESVTSSTGDMTSEYAKPPLNAEKSPPLSIDNSDRSSFYRKNRNGHESEVTSKHNLASIPISKLITDNGQATSRLVCPLADVVDVRGSSTNCTDFLLANHEGETGLKVHHLTFYSKKIGIQFQKACPAPIKPRGLITDAVTADFTQDIDGSYKTAGELKQIPSVALSGKESTDGRLKEIQLKMPMPTDTVLVCGFDGFDASGLNQRPKLGARLVAFDGISVEMGEWTFESIKKAIKSRGRPLTLSFRNDFLTTEQREILTKAIKDVDANRE